MGTGLTDGTDPVLPALHTSLLLSPGRSRSMAPEMDQFYRSTMAIYKVSTTQGAKAGPAPEDRLSVAAACAGREGVGLGRAHLWAWGWGSFWGQSVTPAPT